MVFVDSYFDDSIGDLRNLIGAKSSEELKKLEPQIVFANELELESINIPRTTDLTELLLVHKHLFKPREVFVAKHFIMLGMDNSNRHLLGKFWITS